MEDRELFKIKIDANQLVDYLYEAMLPEGQCYPLPLTRGQAVESVMSLIRDLCRVEWEKLNRESEEHYKLYREAGGKTFVLYHGSALDNQTVKEEEK